MSSRLILRTWPHRHGDSDDPAYFGGYVNGNCVAVAEALGLGKADIVKLARHPIDASLLDEEDRTRLLANWRPR